MRQNYFRSTWRNLARQKDGSNQRLTPLATFRNLILLSLLLPSARTFAQTNTSPNESWLTEYDECQDYGEVYVVKKITKPCRSYQTFLTDKNGRKLTPAYRDIGDFEEGLAEFVPMQLNQQGHGLHGFIDKQGKVIVEPNYISTDRFRQGKTWVIYPADTHY
ncbi:WG repeat-containing protein, partial [Spirosoma flavum]